MMMSSRPQPEAPQCSPAMTDILTFEQIGPNDGAAVGGKALSLGMLRAAGFPVPPGFCVTCDTYRRLQDSSFNPDPELREALSAAYRDLGGGPVAVRSSAPVEDSAARSFAGQFETV